MSPSSKEQQRLPLRLQGTSSGCPSWLSRPCATITGEKPHQLELHQLWLLSAKRVHEIKGSLVLYAGGPRVELATVSSTPSLKNSGHQNCCCVWLSGHSRMTRTGRGSQLRLMISRFRGIVSGRRC